MTAHKELVERLRKGADDDPSWDESGIISNLTYAMSEAADALESQALEMEGLRKLHPMPADVPLRMKREICVSTGWSGSLVERAYNELRQHMTGQAYAEGVAEMEGLRLKAARYDYLTLQHGDFCVTYADVAPSVIKADTADRLIDAAMAAKGGE
jgi:hypothetical protein